MDHLWKYLPNKKLVKYIRDVGKLENYRITNIEEAKELANKIYLKSNEYNRDVWNLHQAFYNDYPVLYEYDSDPILSRGEIVNYKLNINMDIAEENQRDIEELFYSLRYDEISIVSETTGMDYYNSYSFWRSYAVINYNVDDEELQGMNLDDLRTFIYNLESTILYTPPQIEILNEINANDDDEEVIIDRLVDIIKESRNNIYYNTEFNPALLTSKLKRYKVLYWLLSNNIYKDNNITQILINIDSDYYYELCVVKLNLHYLDIKDLIDTLIVRNEYKKFYILFKYHEYLKNTSSYESIPRNNYGYVESKLSKIDNVHWRRILKFFMSPII